MKLEDLRKKIDETDAKIVKLVAERIRIAEEIGKKKREEGEQIESREREKIVLENVKSIAREENMSQEYIENIYRQIVAACKGTQKKGFQRRDL